MGEISNRVRQIIDYKEISIRMFEQKIGCSNGVIARCIRNKTDISSEWLSRISYNFPDIDAKWLLTGEGSMLRSKNTNTTEEEHQKTDISTAVLERLEQLIIENESLRKELNKIKEVV